MRFTSTPGLYSITSGRMCGGPRMRVRAAQVAAYYLNKILANSCWSVHDSRVVRRQQELRFRTHGGTRAGAGRPAAGPRSIRHDKRIRVVASQPIHITCRAIASLGNLRRDVVLAALRVATIVVGQHDDFRIVHASIQRTHLHLVVEADSGAA